MPGVTVTATNLQTQQAHDQVTDGTGFYTFPNLQPGRYDVSAELQGFKKAAARSVQLDAAGSLILDLALETGDDDRGGHGHGRDDAAADRRRGPEDRRGQRHRAAVASTAATRSAWPA